MTLSTKSMAPRHRDVTEAIEVALGDPRDPDNPAGFAALAAQDRDDEFPTAAVAILDRIRVAEYYVPVNDGGRLSDYIEPVQVIRTLARRSLTLAVAHAKTFLGAVTAWVGAKDDQRARLSDLVRSGVPISWALTERAHGSDLLANDATVDDGLLTGTKWLINNASRCGALVAIVRTSPSGGPRGFDLVLVDKKVTAPGGAEPRIRHLPKELTHGIRGADISGIEFESVPIDGADIISEPGHGLENVMKALQLTRAMCCSLSLGAADRGLHTAISFAMHRERFGHRLIELPQSRRILSEALADHLLNDATTTAVIRSIHTLPGELSLHAAAAKYLVPTRTEALLAALRSFMGIDAILDSDDSTAPSLSRIERDHRIVSLFDGNTVVNLSTLIAQFPVLARKKLSADATATVATAPEANLRRLSLISRSGSTLLRSLSDAVEQLDKYRLSDECRRTALALVAVTDDILREVADAPRNPIEIPNTNFFLAERLAAAIAGAAAVHVFLAYVDIASSPLWQDALWLKLALPRALAGADSNATVARQACDHDCAVDALQKLNAIDRGFSVLTGVNDSDAGGRL
ncbi:acyl-CoA dehydrogenase family protein [Mycobacteroides abscessus]|uniref:acyl-CoA dehydrogenase family protein n=1 Tax=Mycobacteroides abscessus TaxID=36809 RepID=UPI00266FF1C2|nr:acyl-CoA dehydrogenase [Mycobacteroides abscessus]MDO3110496.1 acyl-CoA dehydrogenase [Mycobacteroides abscessus subsp. abscessus]